MAFKILNGLSPQALRDKFIFTHEVSSCSTRQSQDLKLYIKKPRLELTKKSFVYRASMLWNELPIHVRQCDTLDSFKIALDIHFSFPQLSSFPISFYNFVKTISNGQFHRPKIGHWSCAGIHEYPHMNSAQSKVDIMWILVCIYYHFMV